MDRERLLEPFESLLRRRDAAIADACVVDQRVDAAEGLHRRLDRRRGVGLVRDVGAQRQMASAERSRGFSRGVEIEVDDADAIAAFSEAARNREADAVGGAGDEGGLRS